MNHPLLTQWVRSLVPQVEGWVYIRIPFSVTTTIEIVIIMLINERTSQDETPPFREN